MTTQTAPESDWRTQLIGYFAGVQPKPPIFKSLPMLMSSGLFHYTTAHGLKGIIEDNCLWATAAAYLNDASEIEYGCTILNEALATWEKAHRGTDSLSMDTVQLLRGIFNDSSSRLERATTIYVACFCTGNNLLSQWRAYGQAGGYSIGFWLIGMLPGVDLGALGPESDRHRAALMPVIYEKEDQLAVLEDALKRNLEVLERPEVKQIYERLETARQQQFVATAVFLIEHFLMEQLVAFKNKAFEEEKEWRIVIRPIFGKGVLSSGEKDSAVHVRTGRGLIIPYVKLVPASGSLPIKSVTIGPMLDKARAKRSVRLLLTLNDLAASIDIDGSDIPVVM